MLRRIQQAGTKDEQNRGLKWLVALPKTLLREPRRGGKKGQGYGEVSARFEAVREGSWGVLLDLLKCDEEAEMKRREVRRVMITEEDPAKIKEKLRKSVLSLIRRGKTGQARRLIRSPGVAPMTDPTVQQTMQSKYPARYQDFPQSVHDGVYVDSLT